MKYFTILIFILILSFLYVALIDNDNDEVEIQQIQLRSDIDTNLVANTPNNSFFKKNDIIFENNLTKKRFIHSDSLKYISSVIGFEDSLIIELDKKNDKNEIYLEFNSFTENDNGYIEIKYDGIRKNITVPINKLQKIRVQIGKVKTDIIVKKGENTEIYDLMVLKSVNRNRDRKKKSIIIFDIAGLQDSLINDTINYPFFSKMKEKAKSFTNTHLLSSNKIESKLSFFKCIEPYLNLDSKIPFQNEKNKIMSELRNLSLPEIYNLAGYNTSYYGSEGPGNEGFSKLFNNSYFIYNQSNEKEKILQKFYEDINKSKSTESFYYLDINEVKPDHKLYLRTIDIYLKELFYRLKSKIEMNDYIFVIISSSSMNIFDPLITMFYSENNIDQDEINDKVTLLDISKTILNYSRLETPYFFNGYDLSDDDGLEDREYITGSDLDTLMFYNDNRLYKKQKYSDKYEIQNIDIVDGVIIKEEDIVHSYNEIIPEYYKGDYIKYMIFKNDSDQPNQFNVKITSKDRFVLLDEIKDYYIQKTKHRTYENNFMVTVEPFTKDTVEVFFRERDQKFNIKFDSKVRLAYGALSINVGEVKEFREESKFGTDHSITEKKEIFEDYDVKILNRRINY